MSAAAYLRSEVSPPPAPPNPPSSQMSLSVCPRLFGGSLSCSCSALSLSVSSFCLLLQRPHACVAAHLSIDTTGKEMDHFNGGRAISLAVTTAACLLSAEPGSAFIAPAVVTSTRASTAASSTPTMVSASPSKTFVTTKSEETFEEAKVCPGRWRRCRPSGVHPRPRKANGIRLQG